MKKNGSLKLNKIKVYLKVDITRCGMGMVGPNRFNISCSHYKNTYILVLHLTV